MHQLLQLVQIFGALLILTAYILSQLGRLDQHSFPYLLLNFIGSFTLGILAMIERQWGFLLLEGVWALVSLRGLIACLRRPSANAHP